MTQAALTDEQFFTDSSAPSSEEEPVSTDSDRDSYGPVKDHPAVADVEVTNMELTSNANGWRAFPHPEAITAHVEEDMDADRATFPEEVQEAIDELTDDPDIGEFLVFDAADAYEYLEKLQWQSDLHLENFYRSQLIVNQMSGGRGYAKGSSLSTYDKKWICQWEVRRRMEENGMNSWGDESKLTGENHGLPGHEES